MRDADFYQKHKDKEEEWGKPIPRRKRARRRLAAMISVRFSPEEEELVRKHAERAGQSLSNFIRLSALKECGLYVSPLLATWTVARPEHGDLGDQVIHGGAVGTVNVRQAERTFTGS